MNYIHCLLLSLALSTTKIFEYVQALEGEGINGADATNHSRFPYQVRILSLSHSLLDSCGGSILDDYHVISAAHCFVDKNFVEWHERPFVVIAGVTDFKNKDRTKWVVANVEKVFVPKQYWEGVKNFDPVKIGDIAVLKLKESLNLSKNSHLRAVELPRSTNELFINEAAQVSGYGNNRMYFVKYSVTGSKLYEGHRDGKLHFANAKVLSNSECQHKIDPKARGYRTYEIKEEHICAQVEQRRGPLKPEGVCSGDSGSPLVLANSYVLLGVVNSGPTGCTEYKAPSTYARVSAFKDFIRKSLDNIADPHIFIKKLPVNDLQNSIEFESMDS